MKKATKHVLKTFPFLKEHIKKERKGDEVLGTLTDEEKVAMKMIWFFEAPDRERFDIHELYGYLSDGQLASALEAINIFFLEDTYLLKEANFNVIRDDEEFLNKTSFATFLTENGVSFSRAKLTMYDKRGVLPEADVVIAGIKYWKKTSCEKYLKTINKNTDI